MSKKLLKEFITLQKGKLQTELKRILLQVETLKKDDPFADPDHVSDNAAVDTDVREQVGHETIEAQVKDLQRRIKDIKLVLTRINKSYGRCERCGQQIAKARLKLIPEARFCVICEKKLRV